MKVDTTHPEYDDACKDWRLVRDCLKGQRHIKARGEDYLNKSGAHKKIESQHNCAGKGPYESYKGGARFPDWVETARNGFLGMATRKPWVIENLPPRLSHLEEDAGNGMPLENWQSLLISEGLATGRYSIFPDTNEDTKETKLAWYSAESLINWKETAGQAYLVVFSEDVPAKEQDIFSHEMDKHYRVVMMDEGKCIVRKYNENMLFSAEDDVLLDHHKGYCPVIVGGALNNDWEVDKPPLIGIAESAISYYVLSAQQRWAIRQTCDPMFLAKGFTPGEIQIWGGGSVFEKESLEASIEVIEVSGSGIEKATAEMQHEREQAKEMMHQLADKGGVEAGVSLRQRANNKTASLKSIDRNGAAALQEALNIAAAIQGSEANITVTSSFDYTEEEIDAVTLRAISETVERGHLPDIAVPEYARSRGMLEGYDSDEITNMIEQDQAKRVENSLALFDPLDDE